VVIAEVGLAVALRFVWRWPGTVLLWRSEGAASIQRAVPSRPKAGGRRATPFIARNGQERRELEHGNWNCEVV
jgi:hypothetical protein